jgi:uncharacterized protein
MPPRRRAAAAPSALVPHQTPQMQRLLAAAESCKLEPLKKYLSAGGSPNILVKFDNGLLDNMFTPMLFKAIARHRSPSFRGSLQALIDAGADVDGMCTNDVAGHRTALMFAAGVVGCAESVSILLRSGADPCLQIPGGTTAMHLVVEEGRADMCKLLINASASTLQVRDCLGKQPVFSAVEHLHVLQLLHKTYGADLSTCDHAGNCLLHYTVEKPDKLPALEYLLSCGLDANTAAVDKHTPIHLAASKGNVAAVQLLLDHGADPALENQQGNNALYEAIRAGHANAVQLLLSTGLTTAGSNSSAMPLLQKAALFRQAAVVQVLLEAGADVNVTTDDGTTALHVAAAQGSAAVVAHLLQHGASLTAVNSKGVMPLFIAARMSVQCLQLLIDAGGELNISTPEGVTLWHVAAMSETAETLQLLLQHRSAIAASLEALAPACTCCGHTTPLMQAGIPANIKLLLAAGADPRATTSTGSTYLHVAAAHSYHVPALCLLIKAGVDVQAVNDQGQTAAEVAAEHGNDLAAALLTRVAAGGA